MISAQEWASIQETLFWQAQPGVHEDIEEGRRAYAQGETWSQEQVRERFGVPGRS